MNTFLQCIYCGRHYIPATVHNTANVFGHCCFSCQELHYPAWHPEQPVAEAHAHTSTVPFGHPTLDLTRGRFESSIQPQARTLPSPARRSQAVQVQALHLRAHAPNPVFIQVTLRAGQAGSVPEPDLRSVFQPGVSLDSQIFHTQVDGTPVRYPLQIFYRTSFLQDGSPPNQCVRSMVHGQAVYPWAGDIVVLKFNGTRMRKYTNMTDNDIPPLGYYFLYTQFEG